MRKTKTSFMRFLRASLENKMIVTERQIQLIQPNITQDEIEESISKAQWHILEQKVQNGSTIYTLIDPCFICTCGKEPVHYHLEQTSMACCGGEDCCPEANHTDIEVQIAEKILNLKERLANTTLSV